MVQLLRILNLEDDPLDSALAGELLAIEGYDCQIDRMDTFGTFQEALEQGSYDLILADFSIPGVDSLEALRLANRIRPEIPFVFFSGSMDEDLAIETLKMGASDYVLKHRSSRLGQAVRRALLEADERARRKRAEEELRKAHDELELRVLERTSELESAMRKLKESNQALQDFAFVASHDLKEPLRKVISFGSMLKRACDHALGEEGNNYLNRMINASERMNSLLTGLLEYSRVSTRSDPFTDVELAEIAGEVLSDLEVRIKKTEAEVHIGDLPVVKADPTQMRQLFQNLIGNGIKFQKKDSKPVLKVWSSAAAGKIQIVFEDNGIGFEEQYLETIFSPFQRLHGRSSEYEGTGMGLAICKKIVERHGGTITARSMPGEGASFIISLPKPGRLDNTGGRNYA